MHFALFKRDLNLQYLQVIIFFFCHFWRCVENAELTPVLRLGAGACAGIIAMSATYPMDMVRGRITVQVCLSFFPLFYTFYFILFYKLRITQLNFGIQTERSPYQYRGMFHALGTVFREEGFRALYKGWLPSVIGVVRTPPPPPSLSAAVLYLMIGNKQNDFVMYDVYTVYIVANASNLKKQNIKQLLCNFWSIHHFSFSERKHPGTLLIQFASLIYKNSLSDPFPALAFFDQNISFDLLESSFLVFIGNI